jgi:ubiquinone biosynthesis protein COQ9
MTPLDELTPAELRLPLVEAMLPNVPFDGWSGASLDLAADSLGVPRARARLAFSGPADMAYAYIELADRRMEEALAALDLPSRKIRDRIRLGVTTRLEQAAPHKEAVRRALAVTMLPANAARSARGLWRTADAIWRAAGDTATDYNHYTKRAILAAVYSATLLYWLQDDSEDFAATRVFLDRRIEGIMAFEKTKARLLSVGSGLPDPVRFLGRLRYPVRG